MWPASSVTSAEAGAQLVHAGAVFHPFEIDELAGEILRGVLANLEFFVGDEISVGAVAVAAGAERFRLDAASGRKPRRHWREMSRHCRPAREPRNFRSSVR